MIFDSSDDFDRVLRLISVAEREWFAYYVPGIASLKQAAQRATPLDQFDRQELEDIFYRLYNMAVTRVGIERIFAEGVGKDLPTMPPPKAGDAQMRDTAPPPSTDIERIRSLAVRATKAQRFSSPLSRSAADLEFIYRHFEWLISIFGRLVVDSQNKSRAAEDNARADAFLRRAEKDIIEAELITLLDEDVELRDVAVKVQKSIVSAVLKCDDDRETERECKRLAELSRQIGAVPDVGGFFAIRAQMLEAYLLSRLLIEKYPDIAPRAVWNPKVLEAIYESIKLCESMIRAAMIGAFDKEGAVGRHLKRRLEQLGLIEGMQLERNLNPSLVTGIRSDLDIIVRIDRAKQMHKVSEEGVRLLVLDVRREIAAAIKKLEEEPPLVSELRDLSMGLVEDFGGLKVQPAGYEPLRQKLLGAHVRVAPINVPYEIPSGDGGNNVPGTGGPDEGDEAAAAEAVEPGSSIQSAQLFIAPFLTSL
ncbi:MAG: hypothetical protein WC956_02255 [bacterium]